jgi:hypothetical protein
MSAFAPKADSASQATNSSYIEARFSQAAFSRYIPTHDKNGHLSQVDINIERLQFCTKGKVITLPSRA